LTFSLLTRNLANVTAIRIGAGDCSAYPNSYFHAGDNADAFFFSPTQSDNPIVNDLPSRINGLNLAVFENKDNSTIPTVFCCDHSSVLDPFGVQTLLLQSDEELGYSVNGGPPETYAHEIGGVRQNGTFLGSGNVTTWGFRRPSEGDSAGYWFVRLLVPGWKDLYDGEFKGFMQVVQPPPP
jgi:hypothetical protein